MLRSNAACGGRLNRAQTASKLSSATRGRCLARGHGVNRLKSAATSAGHSVATLGDAADKVIVISLSLKAFRSSDVTSIEIA